MLYNTYLTNRVRYRYRKQKAEACPRESGEQRTDDRGQMTEGREQRSEPRTRQANEWMRRWVSEKPHNPYFSPRRARSPQRKRCVSHGPAKKYNLMLSAVSAVSAVNDLLYNCRECSTNRPPFLQNKANFYRSQSVRKPFFHRGL